jgi:catechol 2,3-dioxygenase-like lactoylglutathione lyase family enzyme
MRLRQVVIYAADMLASLEFYRDHLGLRPITESAFWAEYDAGGCRIALHPAPLRTPSAGRMFLEMTCADLDGTVAALRARGDRVKGPEVAEGTDRPTAVVLDPNGVQIVLAGEASET